MRDNTLIIAAAGSGKTTFLVRRALQVRSGRVLITTYTEANEAEIKKRITGLKGYIPANIKVQTWFSFLMQHGVRPFQSALDDSIHDRDIGFCLTSKKSGQKIRADGQPIISNGNPIFWGENDFEKFYFTSSFKIYSDKLSKFVFQCNRATNGDLLNRMSRVFGHILVDEVQDLAGFDLELLKLLFRTDSTVLLVGDPRQVTYLTHHSAKHKKYANGNIRTFVEEQLGKRITCTVDENTLKKSHRNNQAICDFSSKLFPDLPTSMACTCAGCRTQPTDHEGLFWIAKEDVDKYLARFQPITQLRWRSTTECNTQFPVMNFGESKGLSFDRVLIYPTDGMKQWIENHNHGLKDETRAKLYVAITRARRSVAFVLDSNNANSLEDITRYREQESEVQRFHRGFRDRYQNRVALGKAGTGTCS